VVSDQEPRGTNVVESIDEPVELNLLAATVFCRLSTRLPLEIAMHAFEAAVLLWLTGLDQPRLNAQADPTHRQLREPLDRVTPVSSAHDHVRDDDSHRSLDEIHVNAECVAWVSKPPTQTVKCFAGANNSRIRRT
jgi:hypothetical protein